MKDQGHPPYQEILFIDSSTGYKFVCGSTLQPKEKEMFEGKEYPIYRLPISSASHPFFTGSKQLIDSEGRVDKFQKRYASKKIEAQEKKEKEKEGKEKGAKKKAQEDTAKKPKKK